MKQGKTLYLTRSFKLKIILFLALNSHFIYAQNRETQLECIQGVWKVIQIEDGLVQYAVTKNNKSIWIAYTDEGLEYYSIFFEGFSNLEGNEIVGFGNVKDFNPADLNASGKYHISFLEKEAFQDSLVDASVQTGFICEGDFIEMSDNAMTILEKQSYMPYTAYHHIKEQGKADNRDYIDEFDILSKLKRAKITVDKTYFHNGQSETTKRRTFVISGDQVIIDEITEHWVKVAYEGEKVTTEGWLIRSDIEIID